MILLAILFLVTATLYSSVGHGGASGYLAVLSITIYAVEDPAWLKQHAWCLNLLVAGLAFFAYRHAGYFNWKLTASFIIASIPAAILGGLLELDHNIYDMLLSITLVFAAWRLMVIKDGESDEVFVKAPPFHISASIGAVIGFFSGIVEVYKKENKKRSKISSKFNYRFIHKLYLRYYFSY